MLLEAKGLQGLAARGLTIIISLRSSHGEIMPIGTYVVEAKGYRGLAAKGFKIIIS